MNYDKPYRCCPLKTVCIPGPPGPEGPQGPEGPPGPQGKPGIFNNIYSQFIIDDNQPVQNGDYISMFPYIQRTDDITLSDDRKVIILKPGSVLLFSYIISGTIPAGNYMQILPVMGRSNDYEYSAYAHSSVSDYPVTASASYIFFIPVTAYQRFKLVTSYTGELSLSGSVSIVKVADLGLNTYSENNQHTAKFAQPNAQV